MLNNIIDIIQSWPVGWQFSMIVIASILLTHITVSGMTAFGSIINSLAIIIRGWPKSETLPSSNDDDNEK